MSFAAVGRSHSSLSSSIETVIVLFKAGITSSPEKKMHNIFLIASSLKSLEPFKQNLHSRDGPNCS